MSKKEEWMVHIWGGAWNHDANPSIEKDLGIKEGYYYFNTEEEKNKFIQLIRQDKYEKQGLATDCKHGIMTHKRTIVVATLKYKYKKGRRNMNTQTELQEMCEKPTPLGVGWIAQIMCM